MRKNTIVSFECDGKVIQKGILLIRNCTKFIVYAPGEINTWYKQDNDKYTIGISRNECHRIPEFDEYLDSDEKPVYTLQSDLDEYGLSLIPLYKRDYENIHIEDYSGVELKGIVLGHLSNFEMRIENTTDELRRSLYAIYDGTKISLWELEEVTNEVELSMKYPSYFKEIYIYSISNNPDLDRYIGEPLYNKTIDKIDYFKLSDEDQKKVIGLIEVRDKNMLDYRIEKISSYLKNNNLLEESLILSESIGDTKSSGILYNLIELLKK